MKENKSHSGNKIYLDINVLTAARHRFVDIFDGFRRVCVSFSGGKDSTVMFHLAAEEARKQNKKFCVLFIDWEIQYNATIQHVQSMKEQYADCISNFYWVCLPLTTVNGVSALEPEWTAWESGANWVRQPPEGAITAPDFFPFYQPGMTFESFIPAFNHWFAQDEFTAILVGIRTDESLNRFIAINSKRKLRLSPERPWTTRQSNGNCYLAYPLYDWRVRDIWRYHAVSHLPYNPIYDLMFRAGVTLASMRICEPFGPEQRKGLWLYHIIEPETWSLACGRVSGAASGAKYVKKDKSYFGGHSISKPASFTWQQYAKFLLSGLPPHTAEHYLTKIAIYLHWYQEREWPHGIPDEQSCDTGSKDIPSWRRICKIILRNDYWCRGLSFSPTKKTNYQRYMARIKCKRKEWGGL